MKKQSFLIAVVLSLTFFACKKSSVSTDVKSYLTGNWAGAQQLTGASGPYKFSLAIKSDNTLINIDSAFNNESYPGTYTYSTDSLIIDYNNTTKWRLKFSNNYSACSGTVVGYAGATGTVSMTKK